MKTIYYCTLLTFFIFLNITVSKGQITITNEHMPQVGDTVRVSQTTLIDLPDPALTGFDYNWDYSGLESASQTVLQFVSPSQTPGLYQIIFNPFVTNLASPITQLDFIQFDVTDAYVYYKNSSAEYTRVGYAATFMGLPIPMKYNQAERIYKFPLSVNSVPDSTQSQFTVQYPNVAYFDLQRKRVNEVDGSGTVTTPYGTFNTIRVKSTIFERDSLYVDSLQFGAPIIRNIIEYQWLSTEYPVPILTISQEGVFYNVQFIDSVKNIVPLSVTLGEDQSICQGESITLTAQTTGGFPPYTYLWNTADTTQSITVTPDEDTIYTVTVFDDYGNFFLDSVEITVIPFKIIDLGNDTTLCAEHNLLFNLEGNYDNITWFINNEVSGSGLTYTIDSTGIGLNTVTLKIVYQTETCSATDEIVITFQICNSIPENSSNRIEISPNPASSSIVVINQNGFSRPDIKITGITGKAVNYRLIEITSERLILDIGELKPGTYIMSIRDDEHVLQGKFIKK